MRLLRLGLPLALLIALSGAHAHHCMPTTSPVLVDLGGVYLVEDPAGCARLYVEANGVPGLQRADECVDDTCAGEVEGDVHAW